MSSTKQKTLLFIAIVSTLLIVLAILVAFWSFERDETIMVRKGYKNKVSFEKCLEKTIRKNGGPIREWSEEYEDCLNNWAILEKKTLKKPTIFEYFMKYIENVLLGLFSGSIALYIIFSSILQFKTCTNLGWRRLTLVVPLIPSLIYALFTYSKTGSMLNGDEIAQNILGSAIAYILVFFITLSARNVYYWIKDGFEKSV